MALGSPNNAALRCAALRNSDRAHADSPKPLLLVLRLRLAHSLVLTELSWPAHLITARRQQHSARRLQHACMERKHLVLQLAAHPGRSPNLAYACLCVVVLHMESTQECSRSAGERRLLLSTVRRASILMSTFCSHPIAYTTKMARDWRQEGR